MPAGDGAECGECDADLGVPLASLALLRPRRRSSVWSAVSELRQAGRQDGAAAAARAGGRRGDEQSCRARVHGICSSNGRTATKGATGETRGGVFFESFHTFRCLERHKQGFYRAEAPITGETKAKWFHIWLI